ILQTYNAEPLLLGLTFLLSRTRRGAVIVVAHVSILDVELPWACYRLQSTTQEAPPVSGAPPRSEKLDQPVCNRQGQRKQRRQTRSRFKHEFRFSHRPLSRS